MDAAIVSFHFTWLEFVRCLTKKTAARSVNYTQ